MIGIKQGTRLMVAALAAACLLTLTSVARADQVPLRARASQELQCSSTAAKLLNAVIVRGSLKLAHTGSVFSQAASSAESWMDGRAGSERRSLAASPYVPEPATVTALIGVGMLALARLLRRRAEV